MNAKLIVILLFGVYCFAVFLDFKQTKKHERTAIQLKELQTKVAAYNSNLASLTNLYNEKIKTLNAEIVTLKTPIIDTNILHTDWIPHGVNGKWAVKKGTTIPVILGFRGDKHVMWKYEGE